MTPTEKAIRDFCGHHADWWPSITQVKEIQSIAQLSPFNPDYNTEAVLVEEMQRMAAELEEAKSWIKNLEKLMAIQDAEMANQTARIVDLQAHIANLEGEE